MDNLLPPIPLHLATLGWLDNQIGVATLGFIVGPQIVSRFPADGTIRAEEYIAVVSDQRDLVAQLESCEWRGVIDVPLDLEGIFESLAWKASVIEDDLRGDMAMLSYGAEVSEVIESQAEVVARDDWAAEIAEIDGDAEISECDGTAEITEKPGQGRCR